MDSKHRHTDECLTYAASTSKAHCIAECRDSFARRELVYGVLGEILTERDRQDEKWGGSGHDDCHSVNDWIAYTVFLMGRMQSMYYHADPAKSARAGFIRIASLAVAVIESIDRKLLQPKENKHG